MIKVNGKDYPWEEGLTIKQILDKKGYTFPLLVVIINGKPVAEGDYLCTVIEDRDDVKVIHLVSGG
ncbi:MAG: sulfur carrier protein ThiS [Desulfitobacteriaceae bacterium]